MSLGVSGLRWVSGGGARHWQTGGSVARPWEYNTVTMWPCSLNWNIGIERISKMCLNHHQKNQGKKFGFIWCLDLIENSMKRANPSIFQGKACHNVLSFDVKQRCSNFFSIKQIQWITAEALFDNRMMLVSWQVNINDREVQINKLHLDSTKLGSVYGWSVNVRSSECWELCPLLLDYKCWHFPHEDARMLHALLFRQDKHGIKLPAFLCLVLNFPYTFST